VLEGFRLRLGPIFQEENLSGTAAAAESNIGARYSGVQMEPMVGCSW